MLLIQIEASNLNHRSTRDSDCSGVNLFLVTPYLNTGLLEIN
jgi:hypothetical protein